MNYLKNNDVLIMQKFVTSDEYTFQHILCRHFFFPWMKLHFQYGFCPLGSKCGTGKALAHKVSENQTTEIFLVWNKFFVLKFLCFLWTALLALLLDTGITDWQDLQKQLYSPPTVRIWLWVPTQVHHYFRDHDTS